MTLLHNILDVLNDASLWLLLGLLSAGLIKAWIPEDLMSRWLGGSGLWPVTKAAVVGAPLPLCSCGVLPAAVGLRRGGASKEATLSFLIATPETGVDSVAVTYALLGPFIAIYRPIAAITSAIFTGLTATLMLRSENTEPAKPAFQPNAAFGNITIQSAVPPPPPTPGFTRRTYDGMIYAFTTLLDGIIHWILLGVVLAGIVLTIAPPDLLSTWGSGLPAMVMMILIGIPMYICATASTPIGAALLLAGMSPGTVLVFLMAGPATNIGTLAVVKKEMGQRAVYAYLIGMVTSSITLGLTLDWSIATLEIDIQAQLENSSHFVSHELEQAAMLLLVGLSLMSLKRWHDSRPATTECA